MDSKILSNKLTFVVDAQGEEYCAEIASEMVSLFGVTEEEAFGRINDFFKHQEIVGELDPVYHELPDYWAKTMYYGPGVYWWLEGQELHPRAYS